MGIDCTIVNNKGELTSLLGEFGHFNISYAIEHVIQQPFDKTANECYKIVYDCTGILLTLKYDQDDNIWTTDDIKDMLKTVQEDVEEPSEYKNEITKFLTFMGEHELNFQIW